MYSTTVRLNLETHWFKQSTVRSDLRVRLGACSLTLRTPYTRLANRMTLIVMFEDDLERIERFTAILA